MIHKVIVAKVTACGLNLYEKPATWELSGAFCIAILQFCPAWLSNKSLCAVFCLGESSRRVYVVPEASSQVSASCISSNTVVKGIVFPPKVSI